MNRRHSIAARLLAGTLAACALLAVAPAVAQQNNSGNPTNQLTPPTPVPPNKPANHLGGIAMSIVLGLLVVGVNFIPSKRGHQD